MKYKLKKLNESKIIFYGICVVIFTFAITLNHYTPYLADDFTYMQSFLTKDSIRTIADLLASMKIHYFCMNGRTIAHTFDQILMLTPKFIFNIINSLMFVLLFVLINKLASKKTNNILHIGSFCMFMIFVKAFGQTCLWQTGACNYLWSFVFALSFILLVKNSAELHYQITTGRKIALILIAIITGGYLESTYSTASDTSTSAPIYTTATSNASITISGGYFKTGSKFGLKAAGSGSGSLSKITAGKWNKSPLTDTNIKLPSGYSLSNISEGDYKFEVVKN